jgi:hypothetical protein
LKERKLRVAEFEEDDAANADYDDADDDDDAGAPRGANRRKVVAEKEVGT